MPNVDQPEERHGHGQHEPTLASAIFLLTHELREWRKQREIEHEWHKSHAGLATKHDLEKLGAKIMATQAELAADLKAVAEQQRKTITEIKGVQTATDALKAKIAELEALIAAGGPISEELVQAVSDVKSLAQVVDDEIPDSPVLPQPEGRTAGRT